MAAVREAVAMATCWQLLSLYLESNGCSLSTGREGGEGEGGKGRKEVRGTVWERVDLPKGNNTRSLCQKTKGLLAGKRATKEQQ